ncbi:hypothetical protein [Methylacidimicrobium sp. B4]|uniref:hypothetical protein n=1 Tax=Methylacidimicrobium sp. B4 TaxID=2796139 RepID=UPI001A8DF3E9|nr:hypothetical protein [Methylacidimicrobium sp. B4]QSR84724.1 hypothetical protein MacB4_00060 [Methylacidimicrobium sp. B4]
MLRLETSGKPFVNRFFEPPLRLVVQAEGENRLRLLKPPPPARLVLRRRAFSQRKSLVSSLFSHFILS